MKKIELRVDVTPVVALPGRHELAATLYLPDAARLGTRPIVMFAIPGGGYSRGYFDMHFAGHAGYSQVEHHLERGIVFVAMDPLGVGDSTIPDLGAITLEMLGVSYDAAVRSVLTDLRAGAVVAGYPAIRQPFVAGIGQSMGGCVTILAQGAHRTFDAIAPLGYSGVHTMLPLRTNAARHKAAAAFHGGREVDTQSLSIEYTTSQIDDFKYPFHWEDVPQDILDADMAGGYPQRRTVPSFGSGTIPHCAVMMMSPGIVSKEAAAIEVPVFVGCGERDVCPDPHAEPSAYRGSHDITLMIVPRMAHMHNFAGTRALLWERLAGWVSTLATQ